ncbi:protein CpxP [Oxalobacteraceae bacterium GrIS 1.11]
MTTLRSSLLIGLSALAMGSVTLSARADEGRHGHMATQEADSAKSAEHMAKFQARLHDKLKLSAEQEPAWTTFIAASAPPASIARPDRAAIAKMTAPERLEKWIEASKTHIATQESRLAALKTFYALLTPEQKKTFDDSVPGGAHGPHHGHMMR